MTSHVIPNAVMALALAAVVSSPTVAGFLARSSLAAMLQLAGVLDHNTALAIAQHWHW
jgi:hypothetical protein